MAELQLYWSKSKPQDSHSGLQKLGPSILVAKYFVDWELGGKDFAKKCYSESTRT